MLDGAVLPPAGDATPEQEMVRWVLLIASSLIALGVGYLVTAPVGSSFLNLECHLLRYYYPRIG